MNITDRIFKKRIFLIIGITIGVYIIFRYLLPLVIPFILATFLSKCLYPVAVKITKIFKIPYKISVVFTVLLFSFLLSAIVGTILFAAFKQIRYFVANMPFYQTGFLKHIERMCNCCDSWFGMPGGRMYEFFQLGTDYLGENWFEKIMPFVTERAWGMCTLIFSGTIVFVFFLIGATLILEEYDMICRDIRRSYIIGKIRPLLINLKTVLCAYFKTQLIIVCLITVTCTVGLLLLKNSYAFLIGIIIALIDAFPIVGSGVILVPWAIIYAIRGDFVSASVLAGIYVICMLLREVLEPKIMGHQTGLRPIYTFISFYVGIRLFGIIGVILGPVGAVIIKNIYLMTTSPNEQSP